MWFQKKVSYNWSRISENKVSPWTKKVFFFSTCGRNSQNSEKNINLRIKLNFKVKTLRLFKGEKPHQDSTMWHKLKQCFPVPPPYNRITEFSNNMSIKCMELTDIFYHCITTANINNNTYSNILNHCNF